MSEFNVFASFVTHPDHHEFFRRKELLREWVRTYPMLFDEDDLRIAESQAGHGFHFHEWLAAVLVYHSHGLLSLIEKYQFRTHPKKLAILEKLTTPKIIAFIQSHPMYGNIQCPDLLVYKADFSEWFFCEVKGPSDRLRKEQIRFFEALHEKTGKPIRLIELNYLASIGPDRV